MNQESKRKIINPYPRGWWLVADSFNRYIGLLCTWARKSSPNALSRPTSFAAGISNKKTIN
jgi:hypothetical protein